MKREKYQIVNNKRDFRADVLSLLSSALRPRLLRAQKIVVTSTILFGFSAFLINFSTPVYADSLTLTIPSEPLSLDLNPTLNNGFATTSSSFNIKTDNKFGYTTSIKSKNESGDNSLINGNNKLNSISTALSEEAFKSGSEYLNMWGWLPSKLNSEENTSYQTAPAAEEVTIDTIDSANTEGQDYNISLAAKVDSFSPTGNYSNTFVITALSNATPEKDYEPIECIGLEEGQTGSMTDPRDGQTYTIARLKDGKCWMTQNLRITGSSTFQSVHSKILTSYDSDLPDNVTFALPTNANWTDSSTNGNHAYYTNDMNNGAYYTWYTATAGTGTSSMTKNGQNASGSICPKGWKLPSSGDDTNSDFQQLSNYYTNGAQLTASPANFAYAGHFAYYASSLGNQGSNGYYWSSTVSNNEDSYSLSFSVDTVYPANDFYRPLGFSVRCVARSEKRETIGALQTADLWGDSVQEGETAVATDTRDNSTYTVARLKDGKLWMTQNLRLVNKTLTSSDSDVNSNFTIPASSNSGWNNTATNTSKAYYTDDTNYGSIYTWYTATAGEGASSKSSGDTSHSICPKGWRLPTNSEFSTLTSAYNMSEAQADTPNFGSKSWASYCDQYGCPNSLGSSGGWWSSTAESSDRAYVLRSDSSNFLTSSYRKGYGFSVRCVQREYKSMQKVNEWKNEVKEGETVEARDERDGSIYTVAKLKDGNLWMTQNLRIVGKAITSADSDVTSNYTIPNSATWTDTDSSANSNHAYYADNPSYGAYYTWYTATAGTGPSISSRGNNASGSICPKGWKLPSGGTSSSSDFQQLSKYYTTGVQLTASPANFTYAGDLWHKYGSLSGQGSDGKYWSSTVYNSTTAYYMNLDSSSVNPDYTQYHPYGFSVRCLAR